MCVSVLGCVGVFVKAMIHLRAKSCDYNMMTLNCFEVTASLNE